MITIGFDPEVFWTNDKHVVSVIGKLGGTKDKALRVDRVINVLEDNVAAEFNSPPVKSCDAFIKAINKNLEYLEKKANEFGATLARNISSASFPKEELADPRAFIFGCEPDFNAWTMDINPSPHSEDPFLRSAGGHIHVGCKTVPAERLIRAMDLFIGVPSLLMDNDTRRRELYGKAGAFRPKPYGAEYRTPSNFWIFSETTQRFVFDRTHKAVAFAEQQNIEPDSELGIAIQMAINENSSEAMSRVFDMVPEVRV